MQISEVFVDAFSRVQGAVHDVLDGIAPEALCLRPGPGANTVAWLIWHLSRVQDDHVAAVAGRRQAWHEDGWHDRFALPLGPDETGYGHSAAQVGAVRAGSDELLGYYDAVHARTVGFLAGLGDGDLDRVVDRRWDPPVTLGVRLVSVLDDDLQHVGQAAYLRGLAERA